MAGTTTADQKTNCCTAKAHCSSYTCPANYNSITAATTTDCPTNAASCTRDLCCEIDTTKCGGMATGDGTFALTAPATYTCDASAYWDTAKAATTAGATHALTKTNCCTSFGTCAGYSSCAAGYKLKSSPGSIYCVGSSCTTGEASTCCELDTTKCGGVTALTCDNDKYWDTAKAGTAITTPITDATKKSSCCTAVATCSFTSYSSGTPSPSPSPSPSPTPSPSPSGTGTASASGAMGLASFTAG